MISDALALYRALKPDKSKDKELIQAQLVDLVARRREPCARLWGSLWRWVDEVGQLRSDQPGSSTEFRNKLADLRTVLSHALPDVGPLVSFDTFVCLADLYVALGAKTDDTASLNKQLDKVKLALQPGGSETAGRSRWGLLMLLRDEIGSNALAASMILPS